MRALSALAAALSSIGSRLGSVDLRSFGKIDDSLPLLSLKPRGSFYFAHVNGKRSASQRSRSNRRKAKR